MMCTDAPLFTSKVAIKLDDERNTTLRLVFKFLEFSHQPTQTFCAIIFQHFYPKLKENAFLRPFKISLKTGSYLIEPLVERETKRKHSKLTLFPVIYHLTVIKLGVEGGDTVPEPVMNGNTAQQNQLPSVPSNPPAPPQSIPSNPPVPLQSIPSNLPLKQPLPSIEQPSTSKSGQAPTKVSTSNNQPSVPTRQPAVSVPSKQPKNPVPAQPPSASTEIPQPSTSSFMPLSYTSKPPVIPTAKSAKRKMIYKPKPKTVPQSLRNNQKLRKIIDIIKVPLVKSRVRELALECTFRTKPYLQLADPTIITEDDPTVASINPDEGVASLPFTPDEDSPDLFDTQTPSEPIVDTESPSEPIVDTQTPSEPIVETLAEPNVDTLVEPIVETPAESEPAEPDQDNESSSSSQYHDASMLSPPHNPPASLEIVSQDSDQSFKLSGATSEALLETMSVEGLVISHNAEENSISIQHESLLDDTLSLGDSMMAVPDPAEEAELLGS